MLYQGVNLAASPFSRSLDKLQQIVQQACFVPESEQKFAGLQGLIETYGNSPESKVINYVHHFMPGLREKMTTDAEFIRALVINRSKALDIFNGQSLPRYVIDVMAFWVAT